MGNNQVITSTNKRKHPKAAIIFCLIFIVLVTVASVEGYRYLSNSSRDYSDGDIAKSVVGVKLSELSELEITSRIESLRSFKESGLSLSDLLDRVPRSSMFDDGITGLILKVSGDIFTLETGEFYININATEGTVFSHFLDQADNERGKVGDIVIIGEFKEYEDGVDFGKMVVFPNHMKENVLIEKLNEN